MEKTIIALIGVGICVIAIVTLGVLFYKKNKLLQEMGATLQNSEDFTRKMGQVSISEQGAYLRTVAAKVGTFAEKTGILVQHGYISVDEGRRREWLLSSLKDNLNRSAEDLDKQIEN